MMKPENLRIAPPDPYIFKSRLKRRMMALFDLLGGIFFRPKANPVEWASLRRIAVLRLDHLGDVILALPFLEQLQRLAPQAQVDFYVGPWSLEAVRLSGLPVNPVPFKARWFDRTAPDGSAQGLGDLKRFLAQGEYDAAFDLRGDLRHIAAMWRADIRIRAGHTLTGGKFLLTHPTPYFGEMHEIDRNLDILANLGVVFARGLNAHFHPDEVAFRAAREVRDRLGVGRPYIVLHATCAASSKRWPVEHWRRLIDALPSEYDLVLVGTASEKVDMEALLEGCSRKVAVAAGLLDLAGLAAFLKEAWMMIGVDSGPAHVATSVGTPLISIFSGTNRAAQWAPRGERVIILQKNTSCSPCALTICPLNNECVRSVSVEEVLAAVRACSALCS